MPADLPVLSATTIPDFVRAVLELLHQWDEVFGEGEAWFRGVNDRQLPLLPGAYWRANCDEDSTFLTFKNMVPSYVDREPIDDWDWYYLMQHYGLPTRLLDWSESALTALYFAVSTPAIEKGPCVWIIRPARLNALHQSAGAYIFTPQGNAELAAWLPPICGRRKPVKTFQGGGDFTDNSLPVALFPRRSNPRIVSQRGTFTIHGTREDAIETLLLEVDASTPPIARIDLNFVDREELIDDLGSLGVDRTAMFPEPASIAIDIKRNYGIE